MGGLQMSIAFVQRIAVAVVLQGLGGTQRLRTRQSIGLGRLRIFIDVVAEKQHQIGRGLRGIGPGTVEAMFPALAGGHGQTQLAYICSGHRGGTAACGGAEGVATAEAVEIPAVRTQAVDLHMDGMAPFGPGLSLPMSHGLAELGIVRHLPMHGLCCQVGRDRRTKIGQRRCEPCPDQDVVGFRVAAGHSQGERVVGQ